MSNEWKLYDCNSEEEYEYMVEKHKEQQEEQAMLNEYYEVAQKYGFDKQIEQLEQENAELKKLIEDNKIMKRWDDYMHETFEETEKENAELREQVDYLNKIQGSRDYENLQLRTQLANAIVPKFKIGQEVFHIIRRGHHNYGVDECVMVSTLWGYVTSDRVIIGSPANPTDIFGISNIFATQAEAEAALAKIKENK